MKEIIKQHEQQQYSKIVVIFRWLAFLAALIFILFPEEHIAASSRPILYLLFLFGFCYLLFYQHLLPRIHLRYFSSSWKHTLEIFTDILIPALFIWFTEGHSSPLVFFYYLFVARTAFTLERKWVFREAALITLILYFFYTLEAFLKPEIQRYFSHHLVHLTVIVSSLWLLTFLCLNLSQVLHNLVKKQQSLTLRNQKLYEEKEKEVRRISSLNQISRIVTSDLDLERLYLALVKELRKIIPFDRLSISILNETGTKVEAFAATSKGEVVERGVSKPTEVCCASWIVKHRKHLLRADLQRQAHFSSDKLIIQEGMNTCFSLPLFVKDKVRGTFCLYHKKKEAYSEKHLEILRPITDQLAMAIENVALYEQIKKQAVSDSLTGLYDHGYFHQFLSKEFERAKRYQTPLSIIMLDIDEFKEYNDTQGHLTGDEVLKKVAAIFKEIVRDSDIAARYGGDEFVLVLPETSAEGAKAVLERIEVQMKQKKFLGERGETLHLSLSSGISTYPSMAQDKEEMIRKADDLLYHSKKIKKGSLPVPNHQA